MRYAKQPSPPKHPGDGMIWLDTDAGEKWRWRRGRGWVRFLDQRAKNKWKPAELKVLRDYFPTEGAEACAARLPKRGVDGIKTMAFKLGLRSPRGPRGLQLALSGAVVDEAIRLHQVLGWGFERIGRKFGICEGAASNAVLITLARRSGFEPAERDDKGALTERGTAMLREALRKGWKGVDIVARLAVSASSVSHERRRYNAYLKANGKRPLPPPGGGQEYAGRKHPKERLRRVEELYLAGKTTIAIEEETGVSRTQSLRIRAKLVKRLRKKGQLLPNCDRSGRRLHYPRAAGNIPEAARRRFRALLLERSTVRAAAQLCGIGGKSAYAIRDALKKELEAEGLELPPPLNWRSAPRGESQPARWLPVGKRYFDRWRMLMRDHGEVRGTRLMEGEIAATGAALDGLVAALVPLLRKRAPPKVPTFEDQLARIRAGAAIAPRLFVPSRATPDFAGGGSSLAL